MNAPSDKSSGDKRRRALAKLHCAKRDLKLSDEAYRLLLERVTGKTSAADMSERELGAVLDELRAKGFRSPRTTAREGRPGEPQERLIAALWADLRHLGVLTDSSPKALRHFAAKVAGIDSIRWADANQMNKVVQALTAWRRRVLPRRLRSPRR